MISRVAESGDDFTKISKIYQCFQTLIHPALMQRHLSVFSPIYLSFKNTICCQ
ncbi:MAG: hypothetical protein HRU34_17530 [Richelia sp.]|nr:hypothetical protein [Richelia sp.]